MIPDSFARTVSGLHGAAGDEWLRRLPELIAACERRWSLVAGGPFSNLSFNYIAPATRDEGAPVVLKLGVPHREVTTEIAALRLYDGRGAVRLLDADADQGILLLERLHPGAMLSTVADDIRATTSAAAVMRALWRPAPTDHAFPTIARWGTGFGRLRRRFDGGSGPFPAALVDQAERLFSLLLASAGEAVVLHGDLHHFNILSAERAPWLAIDPKGVAGEPAYETGALLRNPMPGLLAMPDVRRVLARRIAVLSDELGIDRARIHGWALAQAVLAAWWSFEDQGSGWRPFIACAALLATIPP